MANSPTELFGKSPGASLGAFAAAGAGIADRFPFLRSRGLKRLLLLVVVGLIAMSSMLVYVKPGQYGIKVVKIGVSRGVHPEAYGPGLYFVPPVFEQMHVLPRSIQVLELTNDRGTASQAARVEKAAHIQTSDGFFVDVDVSVIYHIADPYLVFTTIGPGRLFEDNGVIPKTEPVLKATLGQLTTEEFYNSPLRVQKAHAARDRLNKELESKGLKIDHLLIRYFHYNDEIQKNIEEKKLKDQLVFKNQVEARAAIEGAKLKQVEQEGQQLVAVKLSEGKAYIVRRQAERELYSRKVHAKADLLVKLAEARRTELRNQALQGAGSDRLVGLKMAEALKGLDTVVLPSDGKDGLNPLDLKKTLELFGVRKGGKE